MNICDQIMAVLQQLDVKQIFGVPGDAINPLMKAISDQTKIQYVHVAHEESGAFAASAQAKLTGQLAVCASTVGPGAIHLLNGLYDAKRDCAPVLAILGQVPRSELGTEYHQEIDLHSLFDDVAVYNTEVVCAEQMPRVLLSACNAAISERGIAVLSIPHDVMIEKVDQSEHFALEHKLPVLMPDPEVMDTLIKQLGAAQSIAILAGNGCRQVKDDLLKLAEHLQAPIIYSLKGRDMMPYTHPNVAGGIGMLGTRGGLEATRGCDLLLVLGSDFPYRDWYPRNNPVIHVDNRGQVMGRRVPTETPVVGDVKVVIQQIIQRLPARKDDALLKKVHRSKSLWQRYLNHVSDINRSKSIIHPQAVAHCVGELANDDAIFTFDVGEVTVWTARHLQLKPGNRILTSFNHASMAFAMPGSIGVQFAYPGRQVFSLSGDGGFNMLMGDFLTAVKYDLPIKVIVFNNGILGLVKMEQAAEGMPPTYVGLTDPDYAALAKSMGGAGMTVTDPSALSEGVKAAIASTRPFILDVHVNPDELVLPPKLMAGRALNYGLSLLKGLLIDKHYHKLEKEQDNE